MPLLTRNTSQISQTTNPSYVDAHKQAYFTIPFQIYRSICQSFNLRDVLLNNFSLNRFPFFSEDFFNKSNKI